VAPPFIDVAENVTAAPAHTVAEAVAIFTDAWPPGNTVIVIALDVAGEPVTQVKLDVMIALTTSPLVKLLVV
jgi:hypothetical protein